MAVAAGALDKAGGRVDEHGLLFEYTVKLLLVAGLLELILYRLVSRLGMHLSKVAEKYEAVGIAFQVLSSLGFVLLNTVALLLFLALLLLLFKKTVTAGAEPLGWLVIPSVSLLLMLTVVFLVFEPRMLGSILYNVVSFGVILLLVMQYLGARRSLAQRVFMVCFFLGVSGWLYYQIFSTTYGYLGLFRPPPLVHEANRAGEALMVLASIAAFWAYGWAGFWTRNRRQRRRVLTFTAVGATVFLMLLFMDYFLGLYDAALAESVRKGGEGISWIFQMGMGYTFYLPFALYVLGLLCWSYTVLKLTTSGRVAGYGLGLMFIAGYALQLSHLTLMVVLGLMLLNLDRRRSEVAVGEPVSVKPLVGPAVPMLGEKTSHAG